MKFTAVVLFSFAVREKRKSLYINHVSKIIIKKLYLINKKGISLVCSFLLFLGANSNFNVLYVLQVHSHFGEQGKENIIPENKLDPIPHFTQVKLHKLPII